MNKQNYILVFLLLTTISLFAQKKAIQISGTLTDAQGINAIKLFEHDGIVLKSFMDIGLAPTPDGKANFTITTPPLEKGFYYIGVSEKNFKIMILGDEPVVKITSSAKKFTGGKIENSPVNKAYYDMMNEIKKIQNEYTGLINQYRSANGNVSVIQGLNAKMKVLDDQKLALYKKYKAIDAFVAKSGGLQTYLSYQNNAKEGQSEPDYFANRYFSQVTLSDKDFNRMPHILDAFKSYAFTLASVGLTDEQQQKHINTILTNISPESRTYKSALAGVMLGYMNKNNTNFVYYGKQFLKVYGNGNKDVSNYFRQQIGRIETFTVGKVAPDITQKTPEGTDLALSSLRGKVVLVDFWASWCRPCRLENPHVKKLYSKYKDKGFDIYGVSLDRDKKRWVGAIEADGLEWHQVSDLKGWKNEAAQLYGVTSIPQTLLLDAEGKVIARNLRGDSLDAKLREIFGE